MQVPPKTQPSSRVTVAGPSARADEIPEPRGSADEVPEARGPAAVTPRPLIPAADGLTAAAELRIELRRDHAQAAEPPAGGSHRLPGWLPRLVPAAIAFWIAVPAADSVPLLRMLERITFAIAWPSGVIGTLFGAAAAHLPPAGTTVVVALEVVIPAIVLRARRDRGGP